jgi:hypothetical protein
MGVLYSLGLVIILSYVALRNWNRSQAADTPDRSAGFRPIIGFSRFDGMQSLSLLLANNSGKDVWVEELELFLSGLSAEEQTAEPSFHEIQKIRQMVPFGDTPPISLAQVIYKAAGAPQRNYSCVLSSILRFRIGEERFEKPMENYRVRMLGLTAVGLQRERKPVPPQPALKPQETPELATKLK